MKFVVIAVVLYYLEEIKKYSIFFTFLNSVKGHKQVVKSALQDTVYIIVMFPTSN